MNRFLPSKKLLVFLITTLVILVCSFIYFGFKNKKISYLTNNQKETTQLINKEVQQTLKNDSDGDGLKDWEEILWKTDPHNSDTDGDGTGDNSEVLAGRNPLIAGPNDFLDKKIATTKNTPENPTSENVPLTQTDILSRELFAGYVALKQNDQLGTEQEEQFIDSLVEKNLSSQFNIIKKYTLDDLNITEDNSQDSLQRYIDELKKIDGLDSNLENEAIITKKAVETQSRQELEKINSNIKLYNEMKKQFISLKVPSLASQIHLDIVNTLTELITSISGMLTILDDPITGLKSVKDYFEIKESFLNILNETIVFCNKNNIKL